MAGLGETGSGAIDQATIAFRRLLGDANAGDQARVDILVVLVQRTVVVATWPGREDDIRTLTNSQGETAMPLFTGTEYLEAAARRFGWFNPDGTLQWKEMGARQALRQALARHLRYVVIDIGSSHAVEFGSDEIRPLVSATERPETGPFAGAGRVSTSVREAVQRCSRSGQPPAMADASVRSAPPPPQSQSAYQAQVPPAARIPAEAQVRGAARGAAAGGTPYAQTLPKSDAVVPQVSPQSPAPGAHVGAAAPAAPAQAAHVGAAAAAPAQAGQGSAVVVLDAADFEFAPLMDPFGDDLLDAMSEQLRQFPEVEWASMVAGARGPETYRMVALRISPEFLSRVGEIAGMLQAQAVQHGAALQVALLAQPEQLRKAREVGTVFFPWRR